MMPDPKALEAIADKLLKAEHPMLLAEYAGRRPGGFENMVAARRDRGRRRCGTSTTRSTSPTSIRCA